MKRLFCRLSRRLGHQRGSVLMFAVVMMFLMISFVNILVSSVASRSYFSRKVTTLNEYVNLSENTTTETVKEMRSFMLENVELVQYYFANGYFSSQTPGYASGTNSHHNNMLRTLMSTSAGASYQGLMYNFYTTYIKGSADDTYTTDQTTVMGYYLDAVKVLYAYLTAARLQYSATNASDTGKTDASLYIYPKFVWFLNRANDGYTNASGQQIAGLNSTYYDSKIYVSSFGGSFGDLATKVLTNTEQRAENVAALARQIDSTIGTISFATSTEGNTAARQTELGFVSYYQEVRATVVMPQFVISKLTQVLHDLYPTVSLTEANSESWVQLTSWSRYPTNVQPAHAA